VTRTRPRTGSQFAALKFRDYRRFFFGSLASVGGTQLLIIGQGWLVFEISGSPLDLGLLGVAASVPAIVATLFGGVVADRFDRRHVLMGTSLACALLIAGLAVLDLAGVAKVSHVLAISASISLVMGLDWPARNAIFPSLIDRDHMMSAVALNSMLWQGTRMALPAIGGIVIAASDTSVVFFASAAGFSSMFLVMASFRPGAPIRPPGTSFRQFTDGVRFIAGNRLFAVLIPLSWVLMFFGLSFLQLMPAFADLLASGETGFGALVSAYGVGSLTGTLVVGRFQHARRLGWIILGGLAGSAGALYGFSFVIRFVDALPSPFFTALVLVFLVGFLGSCFTITSMTALQLHVPDSLRGRVMGIHGITFHLIALGGIFGGAVASWSSPAWAVLAGATVVVAAAGWVAVTQPAVRDLAGG